MGKQPGKEKELREMKRYTEKLGGGKIRLRHGDIFHTHYPPKEYRGDAVNRLSAYEDTGLTPSEVAKLAKAKADGRLVVLPCKVGDTVYEIDAICGQGEFLGYEIVKTNIDDQTTLGELGSMYLTHEEAEAALTKMEEQS